MCIRDRQHLWRWRGAGEGERGANHRQHRPYGLPGDEGNRRRDSSHYDWFRLRMLLIRRAAGVTPSGVPPESRPTRPAQGPSAEGPGSPSGTWASPSPDGLRCASRGDQSPHVPPCPPGELGGKGSFHLLGPKAGKVSVPPFQRGAGSRGRAPVARRNGRNTSPKGACFFASFFLR